MVIEFAWPSSESPLILETRQNTTRASFRSIHFRVIRDLGGVNRVQKSMNSERIAGISVQHTMPSADQRKQHNPSSENQHQTRLRHHPYIRLVRLRRQPSPRAVSRIFSDIEEEREVSDGKRELNGDLGAIRRASLEG